MNSLFVLVVITTTANVIGREYLCIFTRYIMYIYCFMFLNPDCLNYLNMQVWRRFWEPHGCCGDEAAAVVNCVGFQHTITIKFHINDITWPLASPPTQLFVQGHVKAGYQRRKRQNTHIAGYFERGIHRSPVDFPSRLASNAQKINAITLSYYSFFALCNRR